jgi:hypothetical protein
MKLTRHIKGSVAVIPAILLSWLFASASNGKEIMGATQFLQQRLGLDPLNDWVDIHTNPPTPATNSFTNSTGTKGSMFYRIRVNR